MTRLIREVDEFVHLSEARIACLGSQRTPMLRGASCRAFIAIPGVQGPLSPLFDWMIANLCEPLFARELPDFLVVIDAAVWPTLDALRQERLVFHELKHVVVREDEFGVPKFGQDHRPALKLIPHDYEFFDSEVRRYGADVCELVDAAVAIAAGSRTGERRRGPRAA